MELLRERAGLTGVKKGKRRTDNDDLERDSERAADVGPSTLMSAGGHINLFEDLERVSPQAPSPSSPSTRRCVFVLRVDVRCRTPSRWCPCARQRRV